MTVRHPVVLVEDEPLARARLKEMLSDISWLEVVGEAENGADGLRLIEKLTPRVVFLDIQMPALSGIDLAAALQHRPLIVFTTAHEQHAVSAFGVRAVDYLVKPFGRKRLADTLGRLEQALSAEPGEPPLRHLLIRTGSKVVPVEIETVIRFEGRDDYVAVHTTERTHLASVRMNELERTLDPESFVRVHRSHIVALAHLRQIHSDGDGWLRLDMADGVTVRASRGRGKALRKRFR